MPTFNLIFSLQTFYQTNSINDFLTFFQNRAILDEEVLKHLFAFFKVSTTKNSMIFSVKAFQLINFAFVNLDK